MERLLYALDPTETDESIVEQRKLLRMGTVRRLDIQVRYGNLSVAGEVEAKGAQLDLPRIERFNLAALPLYGELQESLAAVRPLLQVLEALSANSIALDHAGGVKFISSKF